MPKSALEVIESNRGGRHWSDADSEAARTPSDSLTQMEIEPGFEISLFAAEPLVHDPVSITFDAFGRMFVVEYGDYPEGPPVGENPLSKIVMLDDSDNDGVADRRYVFAEKLDFAHSIMAYKDGLLVGAKTKILYLKDNDGDHVADESHTLFDGFEPAHPQMQIGNPRWGLDNWIYLNYGPGNVTSAANPNDVVKMPRKEFRFHPLTMKFEAGSGLGQFGNTIDRWGHRFYCSNRNPIITTFLSPSVLARNPFHVVPTAFYDVGESGGETSVFPLVEMKSNYLSHSGTHTSACGTTAYNGDLTTGNDSDLANSVFVCEPIGHLVTRSVIRSDGLRLTAQRAQADRDFLASRDTWFRPASLANGPDGALYVADMYRLWVEHPKFLPAEIAATMDWRAGEDRGRIYRIVPKGFQPSRFDAAQTVGDTVEYLKSNNAWRQFLGQRLLVERQSIEEVEAIRKLLRDKNPTTKLHAMWTLDGLSSLQAADLIATMQDDNVDVRVNAIKLAESFLNDRVMFDTVMAHATDGDVRVRFEVALALAGSQSEQATDVLFKLALRDGHDPAFVDGLLTSTKERSGEILEALIDSKDFISSGDVNRVDLIRRLATVIGARGDLNEISRAIRLLTRHNNAHHWWRSAVISGLGQGLPRYRGPLGRLSLIQLLSDPPQAIALSVKNLEQLFDENLRVAIDVERDVHDRAAAIELLAYMPMTVAGPVLSKLLGSDQPVEVQAACIAALNKNGATDAGKIVVDRWSELGPAVRASGLDLILRRVESTKLALEAMEEGKMNASALSIDQRVRLLKHTDEELRNQATNLFGGAVSINRQLVAKEYETSLSLAGSGDEGRKVYHRVCATCHRKDGMGHDAGPDLSDVRSRSKAGLLYEIIDPNSKVEPRFTAYSVLTIDGSVYNGLVTTETTDAVVLKMAEGKQQTIGRAEIEQIKVSDVSLMPEGIEKDVTVQQMADLLEFLKAPP